MASEFLMLAHTFKVKYNISGWFLSEKLDGTRAFWDGGISRGKLTSEVPYANTFKDNRLTDRPISTGLWTRSGKVIYAPDSFIDRLPENVLLDGELYAGRGNFQFLRRTIADFTPTEIDWDHILYRVFDSPNPEVMFQPRLIKVRNDYVFEIKKESLEFAKNTQGSKWGFKETLLFLERKAPEFLLEHEELPFNYKKAMDHVHAKLEELLDKGAEGVMLRTGSWHPMRSHNLLKYKPWHSMDGKVVGYTYGLGKYVGMMGALVVELENKKQLKLSGFTDLQRKFYDPDIEIKAAKHPGDYADSDVNHPLYQLGTIIEFKYRELSDDGIPKEARFYRIKE